MNSILTTAPAAATTGGTFYVGPQHVMILFCAAICGAIAYRQERNVWLGIFFGALGGLLSIIVYLIIGKKRKGEHGDE